MEVLWYPLLDKGGMLSLQHLPRIFVSPGSNNVWGLTICQSVCLCGCLETLDLLVAFHQYMRPSINIRMWYVYSLGQALSDHISINHLVTLTLWPLMTHLSVYLSICLSTDFPVTFWSVQASVHICYSLGPDFQMTPVLTTLWPWPCDPKVEGVEWNSCFTNTFCCSLFFLPSNFAGPLSTGRCSS